MINNNIYVVRGHRGTGKTTWVRVLKKNLKNIEVFDLDEEIEKQTGHSIFELFKEGNFRKIEAQVFEKLVEKVKLIKNRVFISVGAGFTGPFPFPVIHLRRPSDSHGRIFLDRPRLNPHLSPFEEFQKIYQERNKVFSKEHSLVFTRLDYYKNFEDFDKVFLGEPLPFHNGVLSLNLDPCLKPHTSQMDFFIDHKIKMGFKYFELCDTFLKEDQFNYLVSIIPLSQLRFRLLCTQNKFMRNFLIQKKSLKIDWPLEWGTQDVFLQEIKKKHEVMYSLHQRDSHQSVNSILENLSQFGETPIKLAIEIFSFKELEEVHHWVHEDVSKKKHRLFYPRSQTGRWKWYRLLLNQSLYFIQEKEEKILDQPLMAESVQIFKTTLGNPKKFACVLGDPVEMSATPYIQESFFKKYKMPVLKIPMTEDEMTLENLSILKNLGLRFAAVTSPLKQKIFKILPKKSSPVRTLNTLIFVKKQWQGFNTDIQGALQFKKHLLKYQTLVVWGGGGVVESLQYALNLDCLTNKFKDVSFYSARTGKLKTGKGSKNPECVVWAVGRSRMESCLFPPSKWKPHVVLDLNYTQDSPALEYALKVSSKYVSGWKWFEAQALEQRSLFERKK